MHTYDQHLWIALDGEYRVSDSGRIVLYARSLGSLGRIAARLRKQGPDAVWTKLPGLPGDVRDAITAIAAYQDGWADRQDANRQKIDEIGRWDN